MHQHSKWHTDVERGIQMSKVAWCDPGDHAFKANSPGAMSFTGQQTDENGYPQTINMDVCGVHSGNLYGGPAAEEKSRVRELESKYRQDTLDGTGHFVD
jgi:hypothetical protein